MKGGGALACSLHAAAVRVWIGVHGLGKAHDHKVLRCCWSMKAQQTLVAVAVALAVLEYLGPADPSRLVAVALLESLYNCRVPGLLLAVQSLPSMLHHLLAPLQLPPCADCAGYCPTVQHHQ